MTEEEKYTMIKNMRTYGGSFVKALAECFALADPINFYKLLDAFPLYVEKYKNWGVITK